MIEKLINSIPADACKPGFKVLKNSSDNDLISLFYANIDFCLAKNWPDIEFIRTVPGIIDAGIFPDRKLTRVNNEKVVVLGKSDIEIEYNNYNVGRIYVKHNSKIYIKAYGNSRVLVDALDSSQVYIKTFDNATVIVNLYSKAISTGHTKAIIKNKETYDL